MNEDIPHFEPLKPSSVQLSSARLNKVGFAIQGARIQPSVGVRVTNTPAGSTVSVIKKRVAKYVPTLPLTIKQTFPSRVEIVSGKVNNQVPTLNGTALDHDPAPYYDITESKNVWIKCVGTFGTPDTYVITIELTTDSTPPSASSITGTGFVSCFQIGSIEFGSGQITSVTNIFAGGNLGVESFGSTNMWWAT
jgi:hypothetical protein